MPPAFRAGQHDRAHGHARRARAMVRAMTLGHALGIASLLAGCAATEPDASHDTAGSTAAATSSGAGTSTADSGSSSSAADPSDGSTTTTTTGGASSSSSTTTTGEPSLPEGFDPFACATTPPDVLRERLCDEAADPEHAPDEIFIHCRNEGGCLAPAYPEPGESLRVMAWNIERGMELDAQIAAFVDGTLPTPDVLLLGEVDRGCARSGDRNVAWELASALGMDFVYGVEFIELPRPGDAITATCEHGNAILSRHRIGNVELLRHSVNESWYATDEPRLGGRMALMADLAIGDRMVRVAALHFESGVEDGRKREAQAAELADAMLAQANPAIVGGDTNAGLYAIDLALGTHDEATTEAFFTRGFSDAHLAVPQASRVTHPPLLVLDLVLLHGPSAGAATVCPGAVCDALSDHRAVWVDVTLP